MATNIPTKRNTSVFADTITITGNINAPSYNNTNWDTAYSWGNHATQSYATQTYVNNSVSNLINSAPGTLDTLNELAAALGDDPNFATTVSSNIAAKVSKSGDTMTGTLTVPDLTIGSGNKIKFANNDYIRYDDANGVGRFHFDADGGTSNASVQAATFVGALSGNASTATKWATARTLSLTGDVTGSVSWDGSANASITATVTNNSHTHTIANVTGLQAALNGKVDDSQVLTNVPSGAVFTDTVYSLPEATATTRGGIELFSNTDQTVAANGVSSTAGRTYGVQLNSAGQAVVNVPWVDTNTNTWRGIHDTPVNGATTTSISSNWAFDNVKTAVPTGAVFTDTVYSHPSSHPATMISTVDQFAYSNSTNVQDVLDDLDQAIANVNAKDPVLTLSGDVTGTATFTNLGNATLTATVANDSHTHDGRYYTETESDSRFVNVTGDTISGNLHFSQNPVGTTYGNGESAVPTRYISQQVGDNDGWRLYGEAPSSNDVKMIFEVVDDNETGDTWVFRNKRTYSPYTATEDFKIAGEGHITARGNGYVNTNQRIFADNYHPNADKWTTARTNTVTLTGDASGSGSASVDGTGNWTVSVPVVVNNDSHNHNHSDGGFTVNGNLNVTAGADIVCTSGNPFRFQRSSNTQTGQDDNISVYVDDSNIYFTHNNDSDGDASGYNFRYMSGGVAQNLVNFSAGAFTYKGQNVFRDDYHPNADKWTSARTITLSGDLNGSVSLDGSSNVTLSAQVVNNSHSHSNYVTTNTDQIVTGAKELISHANHYSGHLYYDAYDANGMHYPHFLDGSGSTGVRVNWRIYNGSSLRLNTWDYNYNDFHTNVRAPIFYDSNNTSYYADPASTSNFSVLNANTLNITTLNATNLSVSGNTTLGNGNGDTTRVNDMLYVQATDSGDAHMHFGENSSNGYGAYWHWDSGYRMTLNSRNAGTNSSVYYFDTNSTAYLNMGRSIHMQNKSIDYVNQLHFNDNVRFYDDGNDNYLNFKWGDAGAGGIKFYDGNTTIHGYLYGDGSGRFGLLDNDGQWAVHIDTGSNPLQLRCNNNPEFYVYDSYTYSPGSSRAPIFYDSDNTGYFLNPASGSNLNQIRTAGHISVGSHSDGSASSIDTSAVITFGSLATDAINNYSIQTRKENYGGNFNKLDLSFHTGIRLGAHPNYGGVRFFSDQTMGTEIASIGKSGNFIVGNNSVRSPIFYDNNDTSYYVDPNSDSKLKSINGYPAWSGSITVGGDANTYYPVTWWGGNQDQITEIEIYRAYSSTAPSTWNTSTHKGGLSLRFSTNFGGWGGSSYDEKTYDFRETYSSIVADISRFGSQRGICVWLRGGGAVYHIRVRGRDHGPTVTLGSYDPGGNNTGVTSRTDAPKTWLQRTNFLRGGRLYSYDQLVLDHGSDHQTKSGILQSDSSLRSPIFYDSNNTGYYIHADSNSNLNTLSMDGSLTFNNYGVGVTGKYSSTRFQQVFGMDNQYSLASDGVSPSNMYGIAWTHSNNTNTNGRKISGHHACFMSAGTTRAAIGDHIWTSGNITAYSDRRVKTNIEHIPDALDKVCKLNGYTFDRTDFDLDIATGEMPNTRQTGVIAQEVLEVLPEAVTGSEEEHYSVAYGNMVGLLIEAIKEQQTQIEELSSQLNSLKEK